MTAQLKISTDGPAVVLTAGGEWTVDTVQSIYDPMDRIINDVSSGAKLKDKSIRFHAERLDRIDTAGAWILIKLKEACVKSSIPFEVIDLEEEHQELYNRLAGLQTQHEQTATKKRSSLIKGIGKAFTEVFREIYHLIAFFGELFTTFTSALIRPSRFRFGSIMYHLQETGVKAVPIVGLMAFLIGVVLAYQGASQLELFGAEIYTIDLLALSIVRELGILLTAILVAGRSGSAFTAQIGTMQVNQEIDAMKVIGLNPMEVLVLPRVVALMLALPILALVASFMAFVGGGLVVIFVLEIPTMQYLKQLQSVLTLELFAAGMSKGPVFALLIAMVGCQKGMIVSGSADSVGRQTTSSVVTSIFLVIIVNAIFSVYFSTLGL